LTDWKPHDFDDERGELAQTQLGNPT